MFKEALNGGPIQRICGAYEAGGGVWFTPLVQISRRTAAAVLAGKGGEAYVWYLTVRCAGSEWETKPSRLGLIGSVRAGRGSGRSHESCERAITAARPAFQALLAAGLIIPQPLLS